MKNIYREYFDTLKYYLTVLKIDGKNGLIGCSEDEILALKSDKKNFPVAYEEYLRSIGKKFLFEFMDAEDMAYEDLEYVNEFANDVFKNNSLKLDKEFLVISERRNDYISLIFTDEDNPKVWIMSEYWDKNEEENLSVRTESFTDLMNIFFRQTLQNQTASFHFVPQKIKDAEKYIKDLYVLWSKGLNEIKSKIDNGNTNNPLINQLNEYFLKYYLPNEIYFNELLDRKHKSNKKKLLEKEATKENLTSIITGNYSKKQTILERILNLFK